MAFKTFTKTIGGHAFRFDMLAVMYFTEAMDCEPTLRACIDVFQHKPHFLRACTELIRAGYRAANQVVLTDRQACRMIDELSDPQQHELMMLFISTFVGEPAGPLIDMFETTRDLAQNAIPGVDQPTTTTLTQPVRPSLN